MKKVIILHPKQLEDDEVKALTDRIDKMLYTAIKDACDVRAARDEFLEFEQKYGKPVNWSRWTTHLLSMTQTFGDDPRFHVFVVAPEPIVGRATAEIVREALRKNRLVLRLTADQTIVKATKVTDLDPDNFTRGWVVS